LNLSVEAKQNGGTSVREENPQATDQRRRRRRRQLLTFQPAQLFRH